ncbi:MAG: hypothetical protein WA721_18125 [Candidatus Binataceae bacterium]
MHHPMVSSSIHLLSSALSLAIDYMGTSALALGLGLLYVVVKVFLAYRRNRWCAVSAEWKGDAKWGLGLTLAAWSLVFCYCVTRAIYEDHFKSRNAAVQLNDKIRDQDGSLERQNGEIGTLTSEISLKEEAIQGLQDQVRNQQTIINGALFQLGQAGAQPLRLTPYFLGHLPANDNSKLPTNQGSFIVLTNKTITPVQLLLTCDANIYAASGGVLGAGSMMYGGWGGRVTTSKKQFGVGILSPAWSPSNPLIVTIYSNDRINSCSFEEH